jgi:hypothetical protein
MRLEAQEMDGIARSSLADVLSFGVCQAGESVGDVDAADVGW